MNARRIVYVCANVCASVGTMRQLTLRGLFGCKDECVVRARSGSLEVYDLFCGAGGFSTGAVAAGCC